MDHGRMDVLIVGLGNIGQKEVSELSQDPQFNLVGAVDPNGTRRNTARGLVESLYESLDEALSDTNPDLVRIATPPQTHCDLACKAIRAGSDVYLEKIMTITADEARKVLSVADEQDRNVFVRRNAIYTPVYQRAWDALDSIGGVREVQWIEPVGSYDDWSDSKGEWLRNLPGGIISEHLPHALYTVRWFLDGEPEVSDTVNFDSGIHIGLKSGNQRATITYTSNTDLPMLLRIIGSDGILDVDHSSMRIHGPRGFEDYSIEQRTIRANIDDLMGSLQNIFRLAGHAIRRELNLNPDPFYSQSDNYRQFKDIATGAYTERTFRINGGEGLRNVELFEEIWNRADAEKY